MRWGWEDHIKIQSRAQTSGRGGIKMSPGLYLSVEIQCRRLTTNIQGSLVSRRCRGQRIISHGLLWKGWPSFSCHPLGILTKTFSEQRPPAHSNIDILGLIHFVLRCVDNSPQLLVRKKSSSPQQKLYNSIRSQRTFGEKYSLRGTDSQDWKFLTKQSCNIFRFSCYAAGRWNVANNTNLPQFGQL